MTYLVVPLWNQWAMTQAFLESLEAAEPTGSYGLILIDNGSTDATAAALKLWKKRLPFKLIRNRTNRGVAPAWNQGVEAALKAGADWIGILNNDLLLSAGSLARLRVRAERNGWALASPATREGRLDYDLADYAASYTRRCQAWDRPGAWYGWCFLAHQRVFAAVGTFDEGFRLGIGEDEDFFRRAVTAGFQCGTTGASFVHHFGSATIGPLRQRQGKDFEERNLARLQGKHGLASPTRAARRRLQWRRFFSRTWDRLRWGHELKE